MFFAKLSLLLFALGLISCNIDTTKNHRIENETPEFRSLQTQVVSFPNKSGSISYQFSKSLFDSAKLVRIDLFKGENGVSESINIENCGWTFFNCRTKENRHLFSKDDKLDSFIEELSLIERDTCLVHNYYSSNSKVDPTIIFVDKKRAIHAIPYISSVCSCGLREEKRTKLEAVEYKLRRYLMEIGAWDSLIVDPSLPSQKSKEQKIVDTLYSWRFDMDSRIAKSINLFYPLKPFLFSKANVFIANIDTIPYYKADLEGDSVSYIHNDNAHRIVSKFKDDDTTALRKFLNDLSFYEKEEWMASTKRCLGETETRYIYWNDSALNIIHFECATEKQKIWRLDKEIRDWFEMKFNNQFIVK